MEEPQFFSTQSHLTLGKLLDSTPKSFPKKKAKTDPERAA